jgi:hypothetical protein
MAGFTLPMHRICSYRFNLGFIASLPGMLGNVPHEPAPPDTPAKGWPKQIKGGSDEVSTLRLSTRSNKDGDVANAIRRRRLVMVLAAEVLAAEGGR